MAWFRFPILAMAVSFWLASYRRILHVVLVTTAAVMMVMCGILLAELRIEVQKRGRLIWPYGDIVPGGYLAKAGMLAFVIAMTLIFGRNKVIAASATAVTQLSTLPFRFSRASVRILFFAFARHFWRFLPGASICLEPVQLWL